MQLILAYISTAAAKVPASFCIVVKQLLQVGAAKEASTSRASSNTLHSEDIMQTLLVHEPKAGSSRLPDQESSDESDRDVESVSGAAGGTALFQSQSFCLSACLSTYLPACLPVSVSVHLSTCLPVSVYLLACLCLPACLPVSVSVCLPAYQLACLCPPACLSLSLSLSTCLPACQSLSTCLPVSLCLPACLSLSVHLPACLSLSLSPCLPA